MIAIKKIIKKDDLASIKVPEEFGEMIEIIILPAKRDILEDASYFEWDSTDEKEKKAFSVLTASSISEWKSKAEDEVWE